MRKYLLTWYGITDLRASLQLEKTTGPVLGALLAEDYTDVVILGFTNPNKSGNNKHTFGPMIGGIKDLSATETRNAIDVFSNTQEAHSHFIEWLQKQLLKAHKKTTVRIQPVRLEHLNDTEGIYEAATQSLDSVSSESGEKLVTLFLSPGTPVMAFVWAFAALRHPNLKKRLIASSQPGKAPENIALPNEWLEWHGKQIRTTKTQSDSYDVIFHLFGEQRIPSLLGMIQFSSKKHIFVNSEQYPADVMKQFLGDAEYGEASVDPYDAENVRATIIEQIEKLPKDARIAFNLTGGTKLMYAGALAACRKVNATPFYFDSRNNKTIFLNDFDSVETKLISSVETFIKLNSNDLSLSNSGRWNDIPDINNLDRKKLTKHLWKQRSALSELYKKIAPFNDHPRRNFQFTSKNISVSLKEGQKAEITIKSRDGKVACYSFNNWPNFARYLSGGWFEEYTYMRLEPYLKSGQIKDLRIGLEVSFKEDSTDQQSLEVKRRLGHLFGDTYQELDIVFTDGKRLYIIECKAGSVKGEYVRKLESITRYFGGIGGRGLLACCFPPRSAVVKQKANQASNVELFAGSFLFEELEALIYRDCHQK